MASEQNILILKLDEFIRKFYKNQLIKGLLYTSGLLVAAFLFLVIAEYFAEFGTTTRTILFYSFLATSSFVLFKYIAIPVLKAPGFLKSAVEALGGNVDRMIIKEEYHFGGYAKKDASLISFCEKFYNETQIRIEPVYTGKLFFAVNDMINSGYFKQGDKINLIHTGGIYPFSN